MKKIRPLARVPALVPGESFASYVERVAAFCKVDLVVTLSSLGIFDDELYERLNGYGILLSADQLERFSLATRIPNDAAARMLLSFYDGVAFDMRGINPVDVHALRKCAVTEWAYFSGSHACPHCLRETGGAWQLAWKLPWSFACLKHRCYLIARCPSCERRLASGRVDHSLSPLFVLVVPQPGSCGNPKPFGATSRGRSASPCGNLLTELSANPAGRSALRLQKLLNDSLAGHPPKILGSEVSPLNFFRDLRSLCALILHCAEPEDLGKIVEPEMLAFSAFAASRNRKIIDRAESAKPRKCARTKVFIGCQECPELMAAICGFASRILASEKTEAIAEMLRPLTARCITRSSKTCWDIMKMFHFRDTLALAFHESMAHRSTFDRSVGNRSAVAKNIRHTFDPRHIPQLIWKDEFNARFAQFFPMVKENLARRFCAMSLVKLCGNYTWGETAALLALPGNSSVSMANRCVGFLVEPDTKMQFRNALHHVATQLSDVRDKTDFSSRREDLVDFIDIPQQAWIDICGNSGITPGKPGRRSRYAAAWLWADLTGGDWTLAPALRGENARSARDVYRKLSRSIFPKIQMSLHNFGISLLSGAI